MFLVSERTLDVPCQAARARLVNLADGGGLTRVSHTAYQHGLTGLMRVGPLGDLPGASKLVAVRFLEPVERGGVTTMGLRWEATGHAAGLFPVLDANITLTPDGDHRTQMAFTGIYRAPLGRLGAGLDKMILHRMATATIRALLAGVADALTSPATATQGHTPPALRPGHATGDN